MRSIGIQSKRRVVPFGQRYGIKSVASAAANPGSEPKIPPTTPSAVQANSSTVVGTAQRGPGEGNEITLGRHAGKSKYKYKYKYPDSGKRKRSEDTSMGIDDMHMQQKALPGEQYRGGAAMRVPPYQKKRKIKIEPRGSSSNSMMMQNSEAGDQYKKGMAGNNDEKQKDSALDSVGWGASRTKSILELFDTLVGAENIPSEYRTYYEGAKKFLTGLQLGSENLSAALPGLKEYVEAGKNLLSKSRDVAKGYRKSLSRAITKLGSFAKKAALKYTYNEEPTSAGKFVEPTTSSSLPPSTNVMSVDAGISAVPPQDTEGQGDEPAQAYEGGLEKTQSGGDPNRLDPITPATGSRQTPASANSIVSVRQLKAAAEHTARTLGPEAVHGNARERANMGKGALDSYEFQGPYDYPIYPGGRPDDSLTMMGAWKTNHGNDSSLWYSKKTAKGADARRNKYWKWSMKGGGRWRKMNKDEMVNVFQKGGQSDNRFYGTRAGVRFTDFQRQTLSNRDRDVALGKLGNEIRVNSEHGDFSRGRNKYIGADKVGVTTSGGGPPASKIGSLKQDSKQGASELEVGLAGAPVYMEEDDEFGDAFGQLGHKPHLPTGGGGGTSLLGNTLALGGAAAMLANEAVNHGQRAIM